MTTPHQNPEQGAKAEPGAAAVRASLLPCPFCGGKPRLEKTKVKNCQLHGEPYQDSVIRCAHCAYGFTKPSDELAAITWNTRAPQPPAEAPAGADQEPETMLDVLIRYERACSRESNPGHDVSEYLRSAVMVMVNYDLYSAGKRQFWSYEEYLASRVEEL